MHNIPTKLNARALVFKNQIGSELVVVLANYLLLDLNPGLSFCEMTCGMVCEHQI